MLNDLLPLSYAESKSRSFASSWTAQSYGDVTQATEIKSRMSTRNVRDCFDFTVGLILGFNYMAKQELRKKKKRSKSHWVQVTFVFWECVSSNMMWSHFCEYVVCAAPKRLLHTASVAEPWHIVAGVRFHCSRKERCFQYKHPGCWACVSKSMKVCAAKITCILRKWWQRIWFSP